MYTKEEILNEMKRVAEKLGVKTLSREEFEQNTTIPNNTLRYYLSSWDQALKDAGLLSDKSGSENKSNKGNNIEINNKREPQSDDELLSDLYRLYKETGETPTAALINSMGRYDCRHYLSRWKSLEDALKLAKKKFSNKSHIVPDSHSDSAEFDKRLFSSLSDFSELGIYQNDLGKDEGGPSIVEVPFASDMLEKDRKAEKEENLFPETEVTEIIAPPQSPTLTPTPVPTLISPPPPIIPPTIKLIPKTIKPKAAKKKPKIVGEAIDFRGLKFAPVDALGVAYLFGIISRELGFVIETFRTEPPNLEGKRCIDPDNDRWEKVKIDFVYKSSNFNTPGHNEIETDIIICWNHDWKDCPVEILELCSTIQLLDNTNSF